MLIFATDLNIFQKFVKTLYRLHTNTSLEYLFQEYLPSYCIIKWGKVLSHRYEYLLLVVALDSTHPNQKRI